MGRQLALNALVAERAIHAEALQELITADGDEVAAELAKVVDDLTFTGPFEPFDRIVIRAVISVLIKELPKLAKKRAEKRAAKKKARTAG
jgi:hypothetical protein